MTTAFPFRHYALTRSKLSVYALIGTVFFCTVETAHAVSPGALDPSFGNAGTRIVAQSNISAGGEFRAIKTQADGKLVAGGTILNAAGTALNGVITRFTPTGALDAGFGVGGVVNLALPPGTTEIAVSDIVVAPDGKIVFTGDAKITAGHSAFLTGRLNIDGSPDPSFGGSGLIVRSIFNTDHGGTNVGVQSDGKVVIFGRYLSTAGLRSMSRFRYNADGTIDTTFQSSNNGAAGGYIDANAMLIRSDDRIAVAVSYALPGATVGNAFQAIIYNFGVNGAPESPTGYGLITTANDTDQLQALSFNGAGEILSAGSALVAGEVVAIARKHAANGQANAAFSNGVYSGTNGGGGVALPGGASANAAGRGIHELANGDVIMTGFVRAGSGNPSWFTSRISSAGVVPTGGYLAKVVEAHSGSLNGAALRSTLAHDGNVVLAGYLTDPNSGRDYPAIAFNGFRNPIGIIVG